MSPNALDRTAAWLLTMNAQLLEDEGLGPDPPHRDRLRSKEELSQAEKVKLDPGSAGQGGCLPEVAGRILSPRALNSHTWPVPSQPLAPREGSCQWNLEDLA